MNPPNRSIVYRVSRSGHVIGEYDIDRIVELLESGEFLWTDLFWAQGMAAWAPLSNLRAEVAAVKAFPVSAAMPTPVASGRRRMQAPSAQMAAPQTSAPGIAGWVWIVAGVTLGALVGLMTTHLFPKVVTVDRPLEKIVEKPVEVIRTVERLVDVPAALSSSQQAAVAFANARDDAYKREAGWRSTSMVPVLDKKVRVVVDSQVVNGTVSIESIRARVESVFRRNGFQVISESDKNEFASTIVIASLLCVDPKNNDQISGHIGLAVKQFVLVGGGGLQKQAWVTMNDYGVTLQYGSKNFYKIPSLFDDLAVEASNDLQKAGQLPYSK